MLGTAGRTPSLWSYNDFYGTFYLLNRPERKTLLDASHSPFHGHCNVPRCICLLFHQSKVAILGTVACARIHGSLSCLLHSGNGSHALCCEWLNLPSSSSGHCKLARHYHPLGLQLRHIGCLPLSHQHQPWNSRLLLS